MIKPIDELSFEEMKSLGIESILWYSAIGRGEYELIRQTELLGFENAIKEFNLFPNNSLDPYEDGIHVDWAKFGNLFYVPKAISNVFVNFNKGKLFAGDDLNAFLGLDALGGTYNRDLVMKIRKEIIEIGEGSKESVLEKLRDSAKRQEAKRYTRHLVDVQKQILLKPEARVAEDYKQPVDAILASYLKEMV